jgi:hypothetical protein
MGAPTSLTQKLFFTSLLTPIQYNSCEINS